jgi:ABC-type amino acid transport substrate-binding protein
MGGEGYCVDVVGGQGRSIRSSLMNEWNGIWKKRCNGVLLTALALLVTSCETAPVREGKKESELPPPPAGLRVGIAPVEPPLAFVKKGEVAGLEADFAEALGRELSRPARLVSLDKGSLIPALQKGEVDIVMSGLEVTGEGVREVAFTEPYFATGPMLLVRDEDLYSYSYPKILTMTSPRIGVLGETESDRYVQAQCPRATRVVVASADEAERMLRKSEIDVFLADALVIWRLARVGSTSGSHEPSGLAAVEYPLTAQYLAWAVAKDDGVLLAEVNGVLARWEESGELRGMVERWIPLNKAR